MRWDSHPPRACRRSDSGRRRRCTNSGQCRTRGQCCDYRTNRAPGKYQESPALAELVKAGKLPAVDQRLPKKPYVPPEPWLTTGKYGGVIQTTANWEWGVQHIMLESQYGHS